MLVVRCIDDNYKWRLRATKFGSSNMFETESTIASIVAHFMSVREIIVMLHLSLSDKRFVTILMMLYPHVDKLNLIHHKIEGKIIIIYIINLLGNKSKKMAKRIY